MLYSMTGYGEAVFEDERLRAGFRIRTVNNKGLDPNLRLPFDFIYLEPALRTMIQEGFRRGRVDVFCEIEIRDPEAMPSATVNRERLNNLVSLCNQLKGEFDIHGHLDINSVIGLPDITLAQRAGFRLPEAMEDAIRHVLGEAIEATLASRAAEGAKLLADFEKRIDKIQAECLALEEEAVQRRAELKEQITARIRMLMEELPLDDLRLNQEVVYHADRLDITEEITRLKVHIGSTKRLFASGRRPLGKELDFLIQEQMREVTTIGNKAKHKSLSNRVVKLKTEYEKIREQAQNIE